MAWAGPLEAEETVVYRYDSLGRLVRVERGGSVNAGVNTNYRYDCADNRGQVTVGAGVAPAPPPPACPPPPRPSGP